jgi:uncharacterized protein Smg (DUF494 family)
MNHSVLDVLIYLFEHCMDGDIDIASAHGAPKLANVPTETGVLNSPIRETIIDRVMVQPTMGIFPSDVEIS